MIWLLQASGLDPPGIKVRASKGLAAVDYFLPGYHVWAHVIEALSDFGYDLNNMVSPSWNLLGNLVLFPTQLPCRVKA